MLVTVQSKLVQLKTAVTSTCLFCESILQQRKGISPKSINPTQVARPPPQLSSHRRAGTLLHHLHTEEARKTSQLSSFTGGQAHFSTVIITQEASQMFWLLFIHRRPGQLLLCYHPSVSQANFHTAVPRTCALPSAHRRPGLLHQLLPHRRPASLTCTLPSAHRRPGLLQQLSPHRRPV